MYLRRRPHYLFVRPRIDVETRRMFLLSLQWRQWCVFRSLIIVVIVIFNIIWHFTWLAFEMLFKCRKKHFAIFSISTDQVETRVFLGYLKSIVWLLSTVIIFTSWTSQPLFVPTSGWAPGATTKWLTVRLTPNWRICAFEYMERSASVKVLSLSSRSHRVDRLTDFILSSYDLLQLLRCFYNDMRHCCIVYTAIAVLYTAIAVHCCIVYTPIAVLYTAIAVHCCIVY